MATAARPRGRGRIDDAFTVGRGGTIRSTAGRVSADNVRIHCYPSKEFHGSSDIIGNVSDALHVVDINALAPDTDFNHPGEVGYFLAVNAGLYESQDNSALMSGGVHVGGVYAFKDETSLVGSQYESVFYITNVPGYAVDLPATASFASGAIYRAQGGDAVTLTADVTDFASGLVATTDGASTLDASRMVNFDASTLAGNGATVDERIGLRVQDVPSNDLGTVTVQVGVEIPVLAFAATNHAIRIGHSTTTTTLDASPAAVVRVWPSTYIADFASASFPRMFDVIGTFEYKQDAVSLLSFSGLWFNPVIKNEPSSSSSLGNTVAVYASATHTADTHPVVGGSIIDLLSQSSFTTTGGGTLSTASAVSLQSQMVVGGGATVDSRMGLSYVDKTGAGTLTVQYAVYIPVLSGANTNVGISNASSLIQSGTAVFSSTVEFDNAVNFTETAALSLEGHVLLYTTTPAADFTSAPDAIASVPSTVILTVDYATPVLPALLDYAPTLVLKQAAGASQFLGVRLHPTVKNAPAAAVLLAGAASRGFADNTVFQGDTQTGLAIGTYNSFRSSLTVGIANAGTITSGTINNFSSTGATIGAGVTITTLTHFIVGAPSIAGTLTTQIGLDIPSLTGAGTNIGIRNASSLAQSGASTFTATVTITDVNVALSTATGTKFGTATNEKLAFYNSTPIVQPVATLDLGTVLSNLGLRAAGTAYPITTTGAVTHGGITVMTPVGKTITAVSDTIPSTGTIIELTNTSGSSKTLTSTPTIADGVDGQIMWITNVGTQDVVLQDQGTLASSGIRMTTATITIGPRDTIAFRYSTTVGDWTQLSFANVI